MVAKVFADGGITINKTCLEGNCEMNVYKMIGLENKSNQTADGFITDAFTGATAFIGTVVTLSLIVSGGILIFAGADEKWADKGKKGVFYSIIGLLLVLFSYVIIRVVQYLAAG